MSRGLIIFAREPVPGKVKTRLAREVGNQCAAELYSAMIEDVLANAASLEGVQPLLFWALDSAEMPAAPIIPGLRILEQHGTTLGARMEAAFRHAFQSGIDVCCIIGTDSPDLPPEYIAEAFDQLEADKADVVFGPAEDGGYYLLGLRQSRRELFADIAWSTSDVLDASLKRATTLGLRTSLLPKWYDIDTLQDLQRLVESQGMSAPRTRAVASRLMKNRTYLGSIPISNPKEIGT
jgi:rSAM/selenodomain-associated transferase 1